VSEGLFLARATSRIAQLPRSRLRLVLTRPTRSTHPNVLPIRGVPSPLALRHSGSSLEPIGTAHMSAKSLLKQYSEERAALVQSALPKAAAIILGRRRVLSGIRWRGDLIVTAAEAIGGAEQVDGFLNQFEGWFAGLALAAWFHSEAVILTTDGRKKKDTNGTNFHEIRKPI